MDKCELYTYKKKVSPLNVETYMEQRLVGVPYLFNCKSSSTSSRSELAMVHMFERCDKSVSLGQSF